MTRSIVHISAFAAVILLCELCPVRAEIDWGSVEEDVNEIRAYVEAAGSDIKSVAEEANPAVASAIKPKVDKGLKRADELFMELYDAVGDEKLFAAKAEPYYKEIKAIYIGFIKDTEDDIKKLPEKDQEKLKNWWNMDYLKLEARLKNTFTQLRS